MWRNRVEKALKFQLCQLYIFSDYKLMTIINNNYTVIYSTLLCNGGTKLGKNVND